MESLRPRLSYVLSPFTSLPFDFRNRCTVSAMLSLPALALR